VSEEKFHEPHSGELLLAEPFMMDQNFRRSVVLICESKEEGVFGLILNKPLELKLNDALAEFPAFDASLHFGGPVQTDTLHYLHNLGDDIEGSVKLSNGLYWGGNFEAIKAMIEQESVKPADIRFFLGYAGWGYGQLVDEMRENSWIIAGARAEHVFSSKPDELWKEVLNSLGGDYKLMSNFPESPLLN